MVDNDYNKLNKDIEMVLEINRKSRMEREMDKYSEILMRNVSSCGAKKVNSKRGKKRINKKNFRNIAITISIISIIISGFSSYLGIQYFRKSKAMDYYNSNFLNEISINVVGEDVETRMYSFIENMQKNGLSEDVVMYYIKDLYGYDIFNIAAKSLGYENGEEYLIKKGYSSKVLSDNGQTILEINPEIIMFDSENREKFIDEVNDIKESRKGL